MLRDRIALRMKKIGTITNAQLARESGISDATVGRLLSGKQTTLKPEKLRKMAGFLDVSYEWLATGNERVVNEQDESISHRVRQRIKITGYGQNEIARMVGVANSTISRIINDESATSFNIQTIERLAHVFGVSFEWLATGKNSSETLSEGACEQDKEVISILIEKIKQLKTEVAHLTHQLEKQGTGAEVENKRILNVFLAKLANDNFSLTYVGKDGETRAIDNNEMLISLLNDLASPEDT